ncbi:MAG: serine hydrolase domain-containing protein, partial [Ginsengibacter sp.]
MKRIIVLVILFALQQNLWAQATGIDSFIRRYVKQHDFGGTILIYKDSKIAYEKSFGLANRSFNVPNKIETKYKIASVTKLFTAVLIMQLYEQGKIDLNKTIKNYLPNYKGEVAGKVTIHQLLNHTSGMVNMDTVTSFESALRNGIPASKYLTSDEVLLKY